MMFPTVASQPRLLVVNSEAAMCSLWSRVLTQRGYHVDTSDTRLAALGHLAQTSYDIVVTELEMPQLDGLELLRLIQSQSSTTNVILITALASLHTARHALRMGAFDYLLAPVDLDELERTIDRCRDTRELHQLQNERQTLNDMLALLDAGRTIGATPDLHTRVEAFVQQLRQRFAPTTVTLSLLDADESTVQLVGQAGYTPALPVRQIKLSGTPTAPVLERAHRELVAYDGSAHMSHVLHVQDRPIGVLQLFWSDHAALPTGNQRRALEFFVASMAELLENGRLYHRLKQQSINTIAALATAIEARDPYTRGHSEQVTQYATRLAERLGYAPDWIERLRYAALLHDIGKIGVPDAVLLKPSPLTTAEIDIMRGHCVIGSSIVAAVLADIASTVRYHHEHWDGSGYPEKLVGEAIPLQARVIAVADAFDAMTSDRAYRMALPVDEAVARLRAGRDTQWQGVLVDAFVEVVEREAPALLAHKLRIT